jgi:hypothetical protein
VESRGKWEDLIRQMANKINKGSNLKKRENKIKKKEIPGRLLSFYFFWSRDVKFFTNFLNNYCQ